MSGQIFNDIECYWSTGLSHRLSRAIIDLFICQKDKINERSHCSAAVKKANAVIGMIKRNVVFKSKDNIVRLYKALVRPKLGHCIQVFSPYLRKDIGLDVIGRVQRRATQMIEGLTLQSFNHSS